MRNRHIHTSNAQPRPIERKRGADVFQLGTRRAPRCFQDWNDYIRETRGMLRHESATSRACQVARVRVRREAMSSSALRIGHFA